MSKTGKRKFKSAEEKRRYEENQKSWEQLKAKYDGPKTLAKPDNVLRYSLTNPPGRERLELHSRNSGLGNAPAPRTMTYTGDKMLGIGLMHKSNFVPVFKEDEAKDLASMRR